MVWFNDQFANELLLAGQYVPAGAYRRLGSDWMVCLEEPDYLPASLDGHVATYLMVPPKSVWADPTPDANGGAKVHVNPIPRGRIGVER